eukprot:scaffold201170_cov33-Tisochrysis_lutea.AAC.11
MGSRSWERHQWYWVPGIQIQLDLELGQFTLRIHPIQVSTFKLHGSLLTLSALLRHATPDFVPAAYEAAAAALPKLLPIRKSMTLHR